jgi:hypothetical protein
MIFLFWETHKLHWAFCLHVSLVDLLISHKDFFFFHFNFFWRVSTRKLCMYVGAHYGSKVMRVYSRPLNRVSNPTIDLLCGGIGILSMEDYASFAFLRSLALVAPYICYRFCIFHRPILEEYVSKLRGAHTPLVKHSRNSI